MNILNTICDYAKIRVQNAKKIMNFDEIKDKANKVKKGDFSFYNSLKNTDFAFICECKKASPSKGIIANEFDYLKIAKDYESAGANAVSVLTEPKWFLGDNLYLEQISQNITIPTLRKDFIIDSYMIYEARLLGASAVLFICSVLDEIKLKEYLKICDDLGICALVEAHDEDEIKKALKVGSKIIGVNNRNLKDFSVDTSNSLNLRKLVPNDVIFIAESGIKDANDIKTLALGGVNGALIGESLMIAVDKAQKLKELKALL